MFGILVRRLQGRYKLMLEVAKRVVRSARFDHVEAQSPEGTSAGFAHAINTGDVESALGFWTGDATLVGADGIETSGSEALREHFAALVALGARLEIAVTDVKLFKTGATARTVMRMTFGPDESTVVTQASVEYALKMDVFLIARDEIRRVSDTSLPYQS